MAAAGPVAIAQQLDAEDAPAQAEELVGTNQVVAKAPDGTVFYLYKHQVSAISLACIHAILTHALTSAVFSPQIDRREATSRSCAAPMGPCASPRSHWSYSSTSP